MTLEECRREVEDWLSLKLVRGQYSAVLAIELAGHMMDRTLNVFAIYDEIGGLEGGSFTRPSSTKLASRFTGPVLGGLWHKHYSTPNFLMRNIINHWTPARLGSLVEEIEGDVAPAAMSEGDVLSYRLVMDGYRDRSREGRLTGEWIVFARHREANIYLTLAGHTETDQTIMARVKHAAGEFPALGL